MKLPIIAAIGLSLLSAPVFAKDANTQTQKATQQNFQLKTTDDKVSYAMGVDIGENLKNQSIKINPDIFVKGIKDAMNGGKFIMTQNDIQSTLATFQKKLVSKQKEEFTEISKKNLAKSDKFLQSNKKKSGIIALASGLQYRITTKGKGTQPTKNDVVTVEYEGRLLDGKVFDSSYTRGEPVTFAMNTVIAGWIEALQLMHSGATWEVFIPPKLAYGERGTLGGPIGPNQALIFKIHLISSEKPGQAAGIQKKNS